MEEQENGMDLKQHALKQGIILGIINMIIGLLIYFIDPTMMAGMSVGLLILAFNLAYIAYVGIKFRNEETNGFLSFGRAYIHGFITFAIAGFLGILFRILLFEVIDPDVVNVLIDSSLETTENMMRNFGADQDAIDKAMEQVEKDMPASFSTFGLLKSYLFSFIFYAIAALITGAIVKKKDPAMEL